MRGQVRLVLVSDAAMPNGVQSWRARELATFASGSNGQLSSTSDSASPAASSGSLEVVVVSLGAKVGSLPCRLARHR